ncbi:hypothetical protein L596_001395 [Steinernema carpocapsae]|uniref:Uncharacterized protein n=1 Tax=Steinernema carpocapsae TaxID=34508 RepID=A0A4V6I7E1_STECR|nr:hypothetical protein L596_001395 [Steinernema carpocapsae]
MSTYQDVNVYLERIAYADGGEERKYRYLMRLIVAFHENPSQKAYAEIEEFVGYLGKSMKHLHEQRNTQTKEVKMLRAKRKKAREDANKVEVAVTKAKENLEKAKLLIEQRAEREALVDKIQKMPTKASVARQMDNVQYELDHLYVEQKRRASKLESYKKKALVVLGFTENSDLFQDDDYNNFIVVERPEKPKRSKNKNHRKSKKRAHRRNHEDLPKPKNSRRPAE